MATNVTAFRSFIAGTGASGALLAAALVSFLLVAGFLALDKLPIGDGARAEVASLGGEQLGLGTPGALAVAGAAGAVAAAPVVVAAAGAAPGAAPGADDGTAPPPDGPPPIDDPREGPGTRDPGDNPPVAGPNPIQRVLGEVDAAVEGATGTNPGLSGLAEPVSGAVYDTLEGATGKDVGGHVEGVTGTLGQ